MRRWMVDGLGLDAPRQLLGLVFSLLLLSLSACSEDEEDVSGEGGAADDGGRADNGGEENPGGQDAGLGGKTGRGGSAGLGGIAAGGASVGGRAGSGGTGTGGTGSGGRVGTGGSGTGGNIAEGGSPAAGNGSGGMSGALEMGGSGAGTAGTAGSDTAGTTNGGTAEGGSGNGGQATGGTGQAGDGAAGAGTGAAGGAESGGEGAGGSSGSGTAGVAGEIGGSTGQDCPDSSAYVGDATWQLEFVVTESGSELCAMSQEGRSLEEDYAAKTKLFIPAGTYRLPESSGTHPFALPVCFERGPGVPGPVFAGAGTDQAQTTSLYGTDFYTHRIAQPLSAEAGGPWSFEMRIEYVVDEGNEPVPVMLDGAGTSSIATWTMGLTGDELECGFDACVPSSYDEEILTVTFDGGQLVLTSRIGMNRVPGMFVGASGTLDGTDFSQEDFWKLVYAPGHHHMVNDYAVLFPTPINGACGLKALQVGDPAGTLSTIDCELTDLEERTVTDVTGG